MSIHVPQNFYKETITRAVTLTGATNIYVSALPTPAQGYIVISPANTTLREIIFFTAKGTDSNGSYITVTAANRGLGGTTAQTHVIGEPVRMNVTAETIQEVSDAIDQIVAGGAQDASTSTKGIVKLSVAPASASEPIAVGINDPILDPGSIQITVPLITNITAGQLVYNNDIISMPSLLLDTAQGSGSNFNIGNDATTTRVAQSFKVNTTSYTSKIKAYFAKSNSPTDDLTISIQADSAGSPSGTDLTSTTFNTTSLTASPVELELVFTSSVLLTAATTYWVVFRRSGATNATHYPMVFGDDSASTYTDGQVSRFNGTTWTASSTQDMQIKLTNTFTLIGVAAESGTTGNSIGVVTVGDSTTHSGLSVGVTYYVDSNNTRNITTTIGATKVGIALSATKLHVLR